MNPSQPSHAAPSREMFFRLADRLQLEACLQAIGQEGKSVILHSVSPGLLDHYGQILVQRLRQQLPQTPTEIFFPTHTEALIARFNELLEDVSVDDATQSADPVPPGKLWIVHDASALPEHELKLLARLLQHLPGARVSAVLMVNGQTEALRNLDPKGRRLMRWDIEPPSQEQIDQLVQEARQMGREFAALELVARLAPPKPLTPTPRPPRDALLSAVPEAPSKPAPDQPPQKRPRRRVLPMLAVAAGLLLLSAGVAAWLNPDAVRQLRERLQEVASAPSPTAPAAPTEPTATAATDSANTDPAPKAADTTDASTPTAQPTSPPPQPAETASQPEAAASESTPASTTPALLTELPEQAQRGLSWLHQLDKDTWLIEHGRHASALAARKQLSANKMLVNARVVPVLRQGNETAEFLVVTGPFRTEERARNFIARNELPRTTPIHASSALLKLAPPANDGPHRR